MNRKRSGQRAATEPPLMYLVTSKAFLEQPHADDRVLVESLCAKGYAAHLVAWSDAAVDWSAADLVIVRSAWDYCEHYASFMAWTDKVAAVTDLWNPGEMIRWNADKRYLVDLQRTGLPIIPTVVLDGYHIEHLQHLFTKWSTRQIVTKPIIGSNAYATRFIQSPVSSEDKEALRQMAQQHVLFAQPYLRAVEDYGERSLVFINGEFVHAFRKTPFYAFSHHDDGKDKETAVYPSKSELSLAQLVMQRLKHRLLFGRVDLLNDDSGSPKIMELEFIEPRLNLHYSDRSLELLTHAIEQRLFALPIRSVSALR